MTYYNRTNTCDLCRINFDIVSGHPHREYNKEGNWTGRWICDKCYQKAYDKERRISNRRTGNLDPNCSSAKGDNFEELTCRWRSIVSTIPIKNLNRELDCYNTPIDLTRDPELGILQTKGCLLKTRKDGREYWSQSFENEHNANANDFEFDVLILYCTNRDGKFVDRIYEFPIEEILKRNGITIYKNPSKGVQWYEKYRVTDVKILELVNKIYKEIINC